jgi:hypothetical protein
MNNFVKNCYYNESNQESIIMYEDYYKRKNLFGWENAAA